MSSLRPERDTYTKFTPALGDGKGKRAAQTHQGKYEREQGEAGKQDGKETLLRPNRLELKYVFETSRCHSHSLFGIVGVQCAADRP